MVAQRAEKMVVALAALWADHLAVERVAWMAVNSVEQRVAVSVFEWAEMKAAGWAVTMVSQ